MVTKRGAWVWKSVVACVLGAAGVGLALRASASSVLDEPPRMDPGCLTSALARNGIPGKASPPLPTDDDDFALAGACSCDASSPAGERPPELEDYRTEHDLGDPVDPHNGMVSLRRTDLCLSGRGLGFAFTRSYSSKAPSSGDVYPLGHGWDHNYNLLLRQSADSSGTIYQLYNGNNRVDTYRQLPSDPNRWYASGVYSELSFTGSEVILRARHGTKTHFTLVTLGEPGRVTKIEDRNGNHLTFAYDQPLIGGILPANARLGTITDPMGRVVTLGYFSTGGNKDRLIHTVTDPTGRVVTFEYAQRFTGDDTSWVLAKARSPVAPVATDPIDPTFTYGWANGKTEGYRYYNGTDTALAYNLASVVAPREYTGDDASGWANGTPYVQFAYDESGGWRDGWCIGQTLGNPADPGTPTGGTISYSYLTQDWQTVEGNPNVVRLKTTVTDRGGRVTDYSFNERGSVLEIDEHDAQVPGAHVRTAFEYYWYYQWWNQGGTWGPDGELKAIHLPNGGLEERFYLNTLMTFAPRWSSGDLTERRFTALDAQGQQVVRSVHYTWDPVYNHPLTVTDEIGNVTSYVYDYMEGSAAAGMEQVMADELWMPVADLHYILTNGYPGLLQNKDLNGDGQQLICRGNVIQKVYPDVHLDAQATGAFTAQTWETDHIQQGIYSLTYNTYGQVTSQTDPEQNATVYLYTKENDLDGNGVADGAGFTGTGTLTGGFLKRVVRDVALPYSDAQLTGVSTRNYTTDVGRDSTDNPSPKAAITDLVHNLRGNLTSYTDPRGVKTDYWVNELEEIWRVAEATAVTPAGRASGWNGADEATSSNFGPLTNIIRRWRYDADGMTIQFQRRNAGNLTDQGTYPGWLEQSFSYDLLNRMRTRIIEYGTAGQTATWTYTYALGDDLLDIVQEPEGSTTLYRYSDRGQVKSVVEGSGTPQSGTTAYTYDADRNLLTVKDPLNHTTTNIYDGFDRLVTVQSPVGTTTTYTYDLASNVSSVLVHGATDGGGTQADLARTEYKYDERSRVYQIDQSDPQSALTDGILTPGDGKVSTRIDLDRVGRRIASITDGAQVYRSYFDGLGNLAKTVDPIRNTVENFCDDNGNLVKIRQTDKYPDVSTRVFETFNIYDALGRTVSTTNNAGDTHRFTYDSRDNVVAASDAQNPLNASGQINGKTVNQPGNTRSYTHNGFDQVLQEMLDLRVGGNGSGVIDTSNTFNIDGHVTMLTAYDRNGRVTSKTDDNLRATSYLYDSRSRVTQQTFADTTHQNYVYDAASNLTQVTDARGNVETLLYDAADRLTSVQAALAAGTIGTQKLVFEYDGVGRRTKSISSDDLVVGSSDDPVVTRTYDALSRVKTDVQNGRTVTSTWAEESKRIGLLYPSGLQIAYTRDSLGRVSAVKPGGGILTTYTYAGYRLHDRTYVNGYSELHHDFNKHTDALYYDDAGRPIKLDYKNTVGTLLTGFEHAYDRMGNRKYERRLHNGSKGDNYVYDSLYRLTSFERLVPSNKVGAPGGTSYQTKKDFKLDGVENWRQLITNGVTQNNSVNSTEGYSAFGSAAPAYDLEGNLTAPDGTSGIVLKYDFLNRLRQVVQGTKVVSHLYDAEGRRVKTTISGVTGAPPSIEYTHDGWEVIEERDGASALMRRWVMGREIDEPLQMENLSFWPNPGVYEFQRSTLGNVVAVTSTSGTVLERYTYDAYGTPQFETVASAVKSVTVSDYGNPYLFNGRRYDPWIYPLYEYRTRMYSPAMGRFAQRDSIGVWGDPGQFGNPLGYTGANPHNWRDPNGRDVRGTLMAIAQGLASGGNAVASAASSVGETISNEASDLGESLEAIGHEMAADGATALEGLLGGTLLDPNIGDHLDEFDIGFRRAYLSRVAYNKNTSPLQKYTDGLLAGGMMGGIRVVGQAPLGGGPLRGPNSGRGLGGSAPKPTTPMPEATPAPTPAPGPGAAEPVPPPVTMEPKAPPTKWTPPTKRGNAPTDENGHPIELHHEGQKPGGLLREMTREEHRGAGTFKANHENTGQCPSDIPPGLRRQQRRQYWRDMWDLGRW